VKVIVASLLISLLVARSYSPGCDQVKTPGVFSKQQGTETVVLDLSSGGTGALTFNRDVPHAVTWEFEPKGEQVLVSGESEVLEKLRRLANLEPPPAGVAVTRRMTVSLGCGCNLRGSTTRLLVDAEGAFTLVRER
jgi:hypothetical protein